MTPLEEQLEKLARRWEKEADEGELLDEVAYALEGAADELRALLPLEVTDESPLRVTVDTADLIELLYGATTDSPANRKARTRLRAALTQPQSEGCPDCESEDGMKDHPDGAAPCPTCRPETDGGGAATAAGARGADLEARIEALAKDWETWDGMRHERYISELRALIEPQSEEPGPYVEAFRERVCPVPEMPSVKYSPSKPVPWLAPEFSGIEKEES